MIKMYSLLESIFTFKGCFLVISGAFFLNFNDILAVTTTYFTHKPGVGKITSSYNKKIKKRVFKVKTTGGDIRLNFYKTPSFDIDICFFKNHESVPTNTLLLRKVYNELYKNEENVKLKNYDMGIFGEYVKTKDFNGKNRISGVVSSYLDSTYVYVFCVEEEFIDYDKIFRNYEEHLEKHIFMENELREKSEEYNSEESEDFTPYPTT